MTKEFNDEQRRIRTILRLLDEFPTTTNFEASIGLRCLDDCAVIPLNSDIDLVVGSDFVRGAGFDLFKRNLLSWEDVGYYLVGANASDLAAMGATPLGVLTVVRYTSSMTDQEHAQVMRGILRACSDFRMPLLGGDSGGYDRSVLSATAIGTCPHGAALLRSGGAAGELLFITGEIGLAAAASAYFAVAQLKGFRLNSQEEAILINPWRKVTPALEQGKLLVEKSLSRCAIDTSDGLRHACNQLAEASLVDVVLIRDAIPVSDLTKRVSDSLNIDPFKLALSESVDFRLLFSVSPANAQSLKEEFDTQGWSLHQIGFLQEPSGTPSVYFKTPTGLEMVPDSGWKPEYADI